MRIIVDTSRLDGLTMSELVYLFSTIGDDDDTLALMHNDELISGEEIDEDENE